MGTKLSDLPALGAVPAADDELPITDVSAADATKKVTVAQLAASVLAPPVALTVAAYTSPVIQTAATDLSGAGMAIYPVGLSGPVDLLVQPSVPASGPGKGVTVAGGVGAADEDGGPLTLDGGPPNGAGTGGNTRIGRENSPEVLIGLEGGGGTVTLEGDVDVLGGTLALDGDMVATGVIVSAPLAPIDEDTTTRTLVASDHGRTIYCSHADGCAITVPTDSLPVGFTCLVVQMTSGGSPGTVTLAGTGAGTLQVNPDFTYELAGIYSVASVVVVDATNVVLSGDLEPA